jgi:hypothetical protein
MSVPRRLPPRGVFLRHVARNALIAFPIIAASLFLGVLGYHVFGGLGWIDSLLNASMILTGMGPVDRMNTDAGKLFASAYALFSGIAFLSSVGVMLAPLLHRFIHRFHLEIEDELDAAPETKPKRHRH